MATPHRALKTDRLYLRLSRRQRKVIDDAAAAADKDVSSFVLDAVLASAQQLLADRREFHLDRKKWTHFVKLLDRPTTPVGRKPRLEKLLKNPSVLERNTRS